MNTNQTIKTEKKIEKSKLKIGVHLSRWFFLFFTSHQTIETDKVYVYVQAILEGH